MKKNNKFQLHPRVTGLVLNTPTNIQNINNAKDDILAASRRPKNPVYLGLIDLKLVAIQSDYLIIESNEQNGCSEAWKHDLGKKLANDYGLGKYCYTSRSNGKRYLFK